ncbi:MAG: hypothetical protein ABUT20_47715, partial [Bacteroidota bacterium]
MRKMNFTLTALFNSSVVKASLFVILFIGSLSLKSFSAIITTTGNGNWSSTVPNAPWPGGTLPSSGDTVVIGNGDTLTVDGNYTCNLLAFYSPASGLGSGVLMVNSGYTLTVATAIQSPGINDNILVDGTYVISGAGTIDCASINCGNNLSTASDGIFTTTLISTIHALNVSGDLTIYGSYYATDTLNNAVFNIQGGVVTINGTIITDNANASNTSTLDLVSSASNPKLVLGGATPFNLSGTGTNTINLNGYAATVDYHYSGSQTVYGTTYTNLTLSGSGNK